MRAAKKMTVTVPAGPIPAAWAARSPFAGADVCEAASWEVLPGAHRPGFDEDLWDMRGLKDTPKAMRKSTKRWDFGKITNPGFRLTAKEYVFALLAPAHEGVIALPDAFRDPRKPSTCHQNVTQLIKWLNWLSEQGVGSLTEVMQEHADAYKDARARRNRRTGAPVAAGGLVTALHPVQYLGYYTELFTADAYLPGFVPWKGKSVNEVAAKKWTEAISTPQVPDAVFQPTVAACLYLVETLGPLVAAEYETMLRVHTEGQETRGTLACYDTPRTREGVAKSLATYVANQVPLPRIDTPRIKFRLSKGWKEDDPLLEVNIFRVLHQGFGAAGLSQKVIEATRPMWLDALALVGVEEEFGRDAAEVPRADDPDARVPWTLPLSAHSLRGLQFVVLGACRVLTAALSGMRASELDEITAASPLPPTALPGGGTRYRLASKLIKGQKLGGVREEWVVLEPAWRAVQLAARLNRANGEERAFALATVDYIHQRLREWVNGEDGQRLGLAPIPPGPVNGRMLRRTLALQLAHRPGGLLAAKIHLKHVSVVTTESYAHRPGGSQAALLADVEKEEQERNLKLTMDAYREYREGRVPAGPGARDLIAAFEHIDAQLADHTPGTATVLEADRRLENLLRKQAQHLHLQAANYCWFRDPSKALCLKLAGTPNAEKPLAGMCDSARCPQATHHPCHLPVWKSTVVSGRVFIDNPRFPKAEKKRLAPEVERAQRVVDEITNSAKVTEGTV